ncbi:conserved hypothetical protein [Talaromyces stipitatus ATCC 10500]|uniref:Myb-like domain-containing protein n=1 Tax=Talaromyces stipitatus (strain ATCC 10500 / CBS 375.48 / QM 6759 / NRRL 1006) TaxID=441959 RepID=B8LZA9_TALSN|nr:uncharacterized protein TSTA_088980 [Talaromyces stipitatus ATCC 10500]EED21662.1 conserved hypothetical protein [Talaromyces stipitatus ATCC 10500]
MVNWTDSVNGKFLIMTLQEVTPQVSGEIWEKVAKKMGPGFSANACRQNYAKLLKAQSSDGTVTPSANSSTPKSASRKRKEAPETPSKTPSSRKQKKMTPAAHLGIPEEEAELKPPQTPHLGVKKQLFSEDSD